MQVPLSFCILFSEENMRPSQNEKKKRKNRLNSFETKKKNILFLNRCVRVQSER